MNEIDRKAANSAIFFIAGFVVLVLILGGTGLFLFVSTWSDWSKGNVPVSESLHNPFSFLIPLFGAGFAIFSFFSLNVFFGLKRSVRFYSQCPPSSILDAKNGAWVQLAGKVKQIVEERQLTLPVFWLEDETGSVLVDAPVASYGIVGAHEFNEEIKPRVGDRLLVFGKSTKIGDSKKISNDGKQLLVFFRGSGAEMVQGAKKYFGTWLFLFIAFGLFAVICFAVYFSAYFSIAFI